MGFLKDLCVEGHWVAGQRQDVCEATVAAVYRHACNDAAAAAIAQDWAECRRMSAIARSIAEAYPEVSDKARFAAEITARWDGAGQKRL